jgi:hypothetical protein
MWVLVEFAWAWVVFAPAEEVIVVPAAYMGVVEDTLVEFEYPASRFPTTPLTPSVWFPLLPWLPAEAAPYVRLRRPAILDPAAALPVDESDAATDEGAGTWET